jgi:hypothetical protein
MENDEIDLFFGLEPKLGSAQCPKCSKFARCVAAGQDSTPDSCDYWYITDCKTCGRQRA